MNSGTGASFFLALVVSGLLLNILSIFFSSIVLEPMLLISLISAFYAGKEKLSVVVH